MMNRKIAAVLALALGLGLLAGCQLAQADDVWSDNDDRLIGALAVDVPMQERDFEAYVEGDNEYEFEDGRVIHQQFEKTYAVRTVSQVTNEETGEVEEVVEYEFEDLDGIPFFCPRVILGDDYTDGYIMNVAGEGMSDMDFRVFVESGAEIGDVIKEEISIEGTIYVKPGEGGRVLTLYPIFQDAEENVYVSGERACPGVLCDTERMGDAGTITFSHSIEVSTNGDKRSEGCNIAVGMVVRYAAEKIGVIMMDAENAVISTEYFKPELVPESIYCPEDAQYMIVETYGKDYTGKDVIDRAVYSRSDTEFQYYSELENGILAEKEAELIWLGEIGGRIL